MWLLAGCSLSTLDHDACTASSQCRDAFGFGWTCGAEGLCTPLETQRRCVQAWPEDLLIRPEEYADSILIGGMLDLASDTTESQAFRLAVKQANDSEGLDGRDFGLVQCTYEEDAALDSLTSDEAAAFAAEWLADQLGARAILGPATSGITEIAYGVAAPLDTMIISPSATSPALTLLDGLVKTEEEPGLLWRTAPPDSLQGAVLAEDVQAHVAADAAVAVIYQTGPYGEGLADVFVTELAGTSLTVTQGVFENDTQRDNAVYEAAQAAVDAVVFISSDLPDVVAFLDGAYGYAQLVDVPVWLADAARDDSLFDDTAATELFDQVRGTAPAVPSGSLYDAFAASYLAEYGEASGSSYGAYAYDAAWLAMIGMAWSQYQEGGISGVGSARGLRHVSSGTDIELRPLDWSTARAQFAEGVGIDVQGASGALDYDTETWETSGPIDIWVIDADGQGFTTVETIEP